MPNLALGLSPAGAFHLTAGEGAESDDVAVLPEPVATRSAFAGGAPRGLLHLATVELASELTPR